MTRAAPSVAKAQRSPATPDPNAALAAGQAPGTTDPSPAFEGRHLEAHAKCMSQRGMSPEIDSSDEKHSHRGRRWGLLLRARVPERASGAASDKNRPQGHWRPPEDARWPVHERSARIRHHAARPLPARPAGVRRAAKPQNIHSAPDHIRGATAWQRSHHRP